jgi:enoyl-CoA hydratase/carnithine racemase
MIEPTTKITIHKRVPGYRRVTLDNPPINTVDDQMYDEVFDLVEATYARPTLKVLTFESADRDFFLADYGVGESTSRFGTPRWLEAATRLAHSDALSIAVLRGRARGKGSELALACDVRFASREKAVLGQPEVGFGLIPGGGALERLPLLVGRSRAMEIVLGADDFDATTAERYGGGPEAGPRDERGVRTRHGSAGGRPLARRRPDALQHRHVRVKRVDARVAEHRPRRRRTGPIEPPLGVPSRP